MTTSQRDQRIDALRGFALGGIVLVNIQSFLYGATHPLGYLTAGSGPIDRAVYWLTAVLVSMKFMPLFAMLFGAGFGLLYRKLAALTDRPARVYRQRMLFLFVFGVLHGVFVYFGDITHLYALAGLVLLRHVDDDVPLLARAVALWWGFAIVVTAALFALIWQLTPPPAEVAADVERNFAVFSTAGYWQQLPQRISAFVDVVVAGLLSFPLTVALMMTGLLAQRAGWLADREHRVWKVAAGIGLLVGFPAALVYGSWSLAQVQRDGFGAYSSAAMVPMMLSIALALLHASLFIRHAPQSVVRWLAPAGRMPLTNYFAQSVAMGALLSGWGFAWGAQLSYAGLAALALAIFALQLLLSRWWLNRRKQGPLEALWRLWTYRSLAAAVR